MLTLAVNEDNDLFLDESGNIVTYRDLDAIIQVIEQAVKTLLGECVLQIDRGMPNFETVWAGSPNILQFNDSLQRVIQSVPGVIDVAYIQNTLEENVLGYRAVIQTIYGEGTIENAIVI